MKKSELKLDKGITYNFDPNATYQGKNFISLSKSSKGLNGKPKFQVITFKKENFQTFVDWFRKCLGAQ